MENAHPIRTLWILLLLAFPSGGCCCLGIPSQRFDRGGGVGFAEGVVMEDYVDGEPSTDCETVVEMDEPCCDEMGCDGACGEGGLGIRAWLAENRQKRNGPPIPRFHPVPTKPVFSRTDWNQSESEIIYGRFGTVETASP